MHEDDTPEGRAEETLLKGRKEVEGSGVFFSHDKANSSSI